MLTFLLVFLSIYVGLHVYLLWKVHAAFPGMGPWRYLLWAFCAVMVAGPVLSRMLDSAGYGRLAGAYGLVCYVWMAAVWWLTVLAVVGDVWNVAARLAGLGWPGARRAVLPPQPRMIVSTALVAVAVVWGLVEARSIRLRTVEIATPRLPPGTKPIRLAQITDLHLGAHVGEGRLARAIERVLEARPDILVSTGDLSDSPLATTRRMAQMLREVEAPLGKFAVTGNHEYYRGLEGSLEFHEAAGFRMLRGESVPIGKHLVLAGVDDPAGRHRDAPCFLDEDAALPPEDDPRAVVLLKHQPFVREESVGRFDVQLSGHTHGGQLWPWHFFTRMTYRYVSGLHRLGGGRSRIYVSPGTGTWGPPLRLFARPEVTLVILRPAAPGSGQSGEDGS